MRIQRFTLSEIEMLIELWRDPACLPYKEMAARLGRSINSIATKVVELRLTTKYPRASCKSRQRAPRRERIEKVRHIPMVAPHIAQIDGHPVVDPRRLMGGR